MTENSRSRKSWLNWHTDLLKMISSGIGTCSPVKLQKAMIYLLQKSRESAEKYVRKSKTKRMKKLCSTLRGFLAHFHLRAAYLSKAMTKPTFEEIVAAILSVILTLEVSLVVESKGLSGQSMRNLIRDFHIYLGHTPCHMWESILWSSKFCHKHKFLNILYERVLSAAPAKIKSPQSYMMFLMVLRMWNRNTDSKQASKIVNLARVTTFSRKKFYKWLRSLPTHLPLTLPKTVNENILIMEVIHGRIDKSTFQQICDIVTHDLTSSYDDDDGNDDRIDSFFNGIHHCRSKEVTKNVVEATEHMSEELNEAVRSIQPISPSEELNKTRLPKRKKEKTRSSGIIHETHPRKKKKRSKGEMNVGEASIETLPSPNLHDTLVEMSRAINGDILSNDDGEINGSKVPENPVSLKKYHFGKNSNGTADVSRLSTGNSVDSSYVVEDGCNTPEGEKINSCKQKRKRTKNVSKRKMCGHKESEGNSITEVIVHDEEPLHETDCSNVQVSKSHTSNHMEHTVQTMKDQDNGVADCTEKHINKNMEKLKWRKNRRQVTSYKSPTHIGFDNDDPETSDTISSEEICLNTSEESTVQTTKDKECQENDFAEKTEEHFTLSMHLLGLKRQNNQKVITSSKRPTHIRFDDPEISDATSSKEICTETPEVQENILTSKGVARDAKERKKKRKKDHDLDRRHENLFTSEDNEISEIVDLELCHDNGGDNFEDVIESPALNENGNDIDSHTCTSYLAEDASCSDIADVHENVLRTKIIVVVCDAKERQHREVIVPTKKTRKGGHVVSHSNENIFYSQDNGISEILALESCHSEAGDSVEAVEESHGLNESVNDTDSHTSLLAEDDESSCNDIAEVQDNVLRSKVSNSKDVAGDAKERQHREVFVSTNDSDNIEDAIQYSCVNLAEDGEASYSGITERVPIKQRKQRFLVSHSKKSFERSTDINAATDGEISDVSTCENNLHKSKKNYSSESQNEPGSKRRISEKLFADLLSSSVTSHATSFESTTELSSRTKTKKFQKNVDKNVVNNAKNDKSSASTCDSQLSGRLNINLLSQTRLATLRSHSVINSNVLTSPDTLDGNIPVENVGISPRTRHQVENGNSVQETDSTVPLTSTDEPAVSNIEDLEQYNQSRIDLHLENTRSVNARRKRKCDPQKYVNKMNNFSRQGFQNAELSEDSNSLSDFDNIQQATQRIRQKSTIDTDQQMTVDNVELSVVRKDNSGSPTTSNSQQQATGTQRIRQESTMETDQEMTVDNVEQSSVLREDNARSPTNSNSQQQGTLRIRQESTVDTDQEMTFDNVEHSSVVRKDCPRSPTKTNSQQNFIHCVNTEKDSASMISTNGHGFCDHNSDNELIVITPQQQACSISSDKKLEKSSQERFNVSPWRKAYEEFVHSNRETDAECSSLIAPEVMETLLDIVNVSINEEINNAENNVPSQVFDENVSSGLVTRNGKSFASPTLSELIPDSYDSNSNEMHVHSPNVSAHLNANSVVTPQVNHQFTGNSAQVNHQFTGNSGCIKVNISINLNRDLEKQISSNSDVSITKLNSSTGDIYRVHSTGSSRSSNENMSERSCNLQMGKRITSTAELAHPCRRTLDFGPSEDRTRPIVSSRAVEVYLQQDGVVSSTNCNNFHIATPLVNQSSQTNLKLTDFHTIVPKSSGALTGKLICTGKSIFDRVEADALKRKCRKLSFSDESSIEDNAEQGEEECNRPPRNSTSN